MISQLAVAIAAMAFVGTVSAQSCELDFDFVSPEGHSDAEQSRATLQKGLGAAAKGDLDTFLSIAADPYIQHSPDLPDGWKPVWDLTANRPEGFSSKLMTWIGPNGFLDNGRYLVMFREVDRGGDEGLSKIFDLMYFDENGKYAEHWDMQQQLSETTASGRSETGAASQFIDSPVSYDEQTENANRRLVADFLNLAFNSGQLETALSLFADSNYVQHSPLIADGSQSVLAAYNSGKRPMPCYDIQFILAQNDLVWVYSKVTNVKGQFAVVDLMRVREGTLLEHWDVVQAVPEKIPHDNGMF